MYNKIGKKQRILKAKFINYCCHNFQLEFDFGNVLIKEKKTKKC